MKEHSRKTLWGIPVITREEAEKICPTEEKMKKEHECTRCGESLTKTYAPFRNFSHCEVCEPNKKDEISDYVKTIPTGRRGISKIKGKSINDFILREKEKNLREFLQQLIALHMKNLEFLRDGEAEFVLDPKYKDEVKAIQDLINTFQWDDE